MDQTFNFRAAPVPLRRRVSPRGVALALAGTVLLLAVGTFSRWVIVSERTSIERAERLPAGHAGVGTISGADGSEIPADLAATSSIDAAARADIRTALDAARDAAAERATFLDAGPGQLAMARGASLVYVDGPSTAPGLVSVATTRSSWGAAAMGPSGTCYLMRFTPNDGITFGTGEECTGEEALTATAAAW